MAYPIVLRSAIFVGIDWICRGILALLTLALAYIVVQSIFLDDPTGRRAAERQAIEQENSAFCGHFGMGLGSVRNGECVERLNQSKPPRAAAFPNERWC